MHKIYVDSPYPKIFYMSQAFLNLPSNYNLNIGFQLLYSSLAQTMSHAFLICIAKSYSHTGSDTVEIMYIRYIEEDLLVNHNVCWLSFIRYSSQFLKHINSFKIRACVGTVSYFLFCYFYKVMVVIIFSYKMSI